MRNKSSDLILQRRYAQKNDKFESLEPTAEDIFRRVAKAVASVEEEGEGRTRIEETFYQLMESCDFLPNSPTLMNAGTPIGLLSACFVVPIGDSMEEIFAALYNGAMIQRYGGGVGYSFTNLRQEGAFVKKTQGKASGPVSFMKAFDAMCGSIKQGGKRRGAQIAVLRIDHPDIMKFIEAKVDNNELTNFNMSIAVTDEFMERLDEHMNLEEYDNKYVSFKLRDPRDGTVVKEVNIGVIWNKIVESAWKTGDPGLWFIDAANNNRPFEDIKIESINPSGEQALKPYNYCNLGSINLGNFIRQTPGLDPSVDWDKLANAATMGVRFLDNVIDLNEYPEQLVVAKNGVPVIQNPIGEMTKYTRRIGLGVMGWADMLANMRIPYDSDEAIELAKSVMSWIKDKAFEASEDLAVERGRFPGWKESNHNSKDSPELDWNTRNAAITTVAPTGTVSRIAGCSSGIEPYFALNYFSNVMDGDVLEDIPVPFLSFLEEGVKLGYIDDYEKHKIIGYVKTHTTQEYSDEYAIAEPDGSGASDWWHDFVSVFKTANEINWNWHVLHQAAFQEFVDNSISKTVNMAEDTSVGAVSKAFIAAYNSGCKGITIYRDKSKNEQILNRYPETIEEITEKAMDAMEEHSGKGYGIGVVLKGKEQFRPTTRERPATLDGKVVRVRTGHGNLFVTLTWDEFGELFETFLTLGRAGSCDSANLQAIAKLSTLALRNRIDPKEIAEMLAGISCHPVWVDGVQIHSAPDALAQVIAAHIGKGDIPVPQKEDLEIQLSARYKPPGSLQEVIALPGTPCLECGTPTIKEEGCRHCRTCGWSDC